MMHSLENNTFFIFLYCAAARGQAVGTEWDCCNRQKAVTQKEQKQGAVLKVDTFREMLCCIRRIQGKSVGQGVVNYITDLGAFHCLKAVKQKS